MSSELTAARTIEFNYAVGIIVGLLRKGVITTEEFDLIETKLKQKYEIKSGSAE